jgi:hypothetical protein
VRPLVVSQAPRAVRQGGGFGRFLLGLAAVAGVGITLYRNGIVREAATSVHQEALYARLETALGGPSFGTLRAVEQSTSEQAAAFAPSSTDALADLPSNAALAKPVSTAATASTAQPTSGSAPPVVSLESLGHEAPGAASPKPETQLASGAPRPVPQSGAQPKFDAAPVVKSAPVAKSAPVTKTVAPSAPPPVKAAKPAPVEKAAPEKPESQMTERERLNAAIAHSMMSSPPTSSKSKSKASEYDPLNPKL